MNQPPRNERETKFTKLQDPDKDLMFISSQIELLKLGSCDLVRELIGDISSDDDEVNDRSFEQYLIFWYSRYGQDKDDWKKDKWPPKILSLHCPQEDFR